MSGTPASLDLCVIGASEAGLAACMGAVALGLSCALVDDGDASGFRNPDLALAALAHQAEAPERHEQAWPAVAQALAQAAPERRHARYRAMNVRLIRGTGRFVDSTTLQAGDTLLRARRFFIATGGRQPSWPLADGLAEGVRLSLGDLGTLRNTPKNAIVVGGSSGAVSLAQSLRRLGSRVTLVAESLLPGHDAELVAPLAAQLRRDGVAILLAGLTAVEACPEGARATLSDGTQVVAAHVLLAEEPHPAVESLAPTQAGLAMRNGVLKLDRGLRTSNRSIYAIGRAAGAGSTAQGVMQAGHALRSAFLPIPSRSRTELVPVVTATRPEIAFVGREPRSKGHRVWRHALAQTGGAAALGSGEGQVKIITDARGRLIWAGLVGPNARESISLWSLAIGRGLTLADLADVAAPMPSLAESIRALAVQDLGRRIASPWARRVLRAARWFG